MIFKNIQLRGVACAAFFIAWTAVSNATSFNCNEPNDVVEKMICNNISPYKIGDLDDQMDHKYKYVLSLIEKPDFLRKSQKIWLSKRNLCKDESCLKKAYISRIGELNQLVQKLESEGVNQKRIKSILRNKQLNLCKKISELYAAAGLQYILPTDNKYSFEARYNNLDIDLDGINDLIVLGGMRESEMQVTLSSGVNYDSSSAHSSNIFRLDSRLYLASYSPTIDEINDTFLESIDWLSPDGIINVCGYDDIKR